MVLGFLVNTAGNLEQTCLFSAFCNIVVFVFRLNYTTFA